MERNLFKNDETNVKLRQVLEELARDLRIPKLEAGELQFTDLTNKNCFIKVYGDKIRIFALGAVSQKEKNVREKTADRDQCSRRKDSNNRFQLTHRPVQPFRKG